METKNKTKNELLTEMQELFDKIKKYENEVKSLLIVIDDLEKKYYEIGEQITQN